MSAVTEKAAAGLFATAVGACATAIVAAVAALTWWVVR